MEFFRKFQGCEQEQPVLPEGSCQLAKEFVRMWLDLAGHWQIWQEGSCQGATECVRKCFLLLEDLKFWRELLWIWWVELLKECGRTFLVKQALLPVLLLLLGQLLLLLVELAERGRQKQRKEQGLTLERQGWSHC